MVPLDSFREMKKCYRKSVNWKVVYSPASSMATSLLKRSICQSMLNEPNKIFSELEFSVHVEPYFFALPKNIMISEMTIDRGMFLCGFLASSPVVATQSKPTKP